MIKKMKFIQITSFLTSLLILGACTILSDDKHVDYGALHKALVAEKDSVVKKEVNKMTANLYPDNSEEDPIGHRKNFDTLIDLLEADGNSGFEAELLCYACIETYPEISEILVRLDSANVEITRVIDVFTPRDDRLRCSGVHR